MQLLSTDAFEGLDVVHGFTTRAGGVSTGPWGPLNLARRAGEPDQILFENWDRVAGVLGLSARDVAIVSQVHGATVVKVTEPSGPLTTQGEADAMWTDRPGVLLGVRVADCVPVLLAGPGGVAVAHAGWRGVASGVVQAAIDALCDGVDCSPGEVCAAVGPHISGAVYEVGDEVVDGLASSGLDPEIFVRGEAAGGPMSISAPLWLLSSPRPASGGHDTSGGAATPSPAFTPIGEMVGPRGEWPASSRGGRDRFLGVADLGGLRTGDP